MAAGDNYKEFDTSSIITSNSGKDSITIGKVTLRKRDALLGGIAIVACLLVIILAIVLAVEVGDKSKDCPSSSASSAAQTGNGDGNGESVGGSANHTCPPPPVVETKPPVTCPPTPSTPEANDNMCDTLPCLQAALYEKTNMNENADPCENFYEFACGGYAKANPRTYHLNDVNPTSKIVSENVDKLVTLLETPSAGPQQSYEKKLKDFMMSCTNHFDKMQLGGIPLINKVLNPAGGWYVLDGTWDPSTFDFHTALKTVHINFWTAAFFTVSITTDQTNWTKKVVQLDFGGVGVPYYVYGDIGTALSVQTVYKAYMRHIAQLLSGDARVAVNNTRIDQFVDDVYEVERSLADVILNSPVALDSHQEASRLTLNQLNTATNNTMDFVDYFKALFNDNPNIITGDFKVAVLRTNFFHTLGPELLKLVATNEGKRKIHNYLMWQLINRYAGELSWEYVHAKRLLSNLLYGNKDTSSGYAACFSVALTFMSDAVNAEYVKQHINEMDRKEATNVLTKVRTALLSDIDTATWMTAADKQIAKNKISNSLYKIGYPDYLVDEKIMDALYDAVTINASDYLGNVLNLNKVSIKYFNDEIVRQNNRQRWYYNTFNPVVEYYNPWHELIATAAVLQYPLFSHEGPSYYNYGGIGTVFAGNLVHAVDEYGNSYKLDGTSYNSWWKNVTAERYAEIKKCAIDAQKDEVLGPFNLGVAFSNYSPNISFYSAAMAPTLLSDASGLRLSYKAFKAKQAADGAEKLPAGLHSYSADQLFFVAHAQAYCQNTPDYLLVDQLRTTYPSKNRINLAVSHVPEFREAFMCKTGQKLAPEKVCTLF